MFSQVEGLSVGTACIGGDWNDIQGMFRRYDAIASGEVNQLRRPAQAGPTKVGRQPVSIIRADCCKVGPAARGQGQQRRAARDGRGGGDAVRHGIARRVVVRRGRAQTTQADAGSGSAWRGARAPMAAACEREAATPCAAATRRPNRKVLEKKEPERQKNLVKASLRKRKRGIHTSKTLAHSSHIQQQVRLSTACNGTLDSTGRVGEGRATGGVQCHAVQYYITWDRVRLLGPPDATCRSKPPSTLSTLVLLIHALLFAPNALIN
ncbi:hypothetical protein C8J57DRAFT_1482487 [Mycena rebaudengoi]|nr:hypothetical protein C8J57DRAFT_1482487 [Mycena rebaudengoi]